MGRILDWIDQQTGWITMWRSFLGQRVPARSGFGHVLGALALFTFLLCAASGVFLLFYYAPTPDHAHDSIRYINEDVAFGAFVRGFHVWTAEALALIIGLHMLRVFIWGAYKGVQRIVWSLGVILLLIVMGLSITAYLLPWSQNGYWATVVRMDIAGSIPIVGSFLKRLALNQDHIGALALSRFFTLHAIILPVIFAVVAAFHLFQVRIHGVTPAGVRVGEESTAPTRPFHPHLTPKLALLTIAMFAICSILARTIGAPIEPRADPSSTFQAHTTWTWLYLYEWAHLFPAKWEFVGAVVIPGLGVIAMLLLPFIDRNPERRVRKRPAAIALVTITFLAVTALGIAGYASSPHPPKLNAIQLEGQRVFLDERCNQCHGINGGGGTGGTDLATKTTKTPEQMRAFLLDPTKPNKRSIMPPTKIANDKMDALVAYMMSMGPASQMPTEPLVGPLKPDSHYEQDWIISHKFQVRQDAGICEACHDAHFCRSCHQNRLPDSHESAKWLKMHAGASFNSGEYCNVCHKSDFCATCHEEVPHGADWLNQHRTAARAHSQICSQCHTRSLCIECHKGAQPPSHGENWLKRHGPASKMPSAGCSTCHPSSQCSACHQNRKPPSHMAVDWPKTHGKWASQGFQDCTLCHGRNSCKTCHKGVTMPHPPTWVAIHGHSGASFAVGANCFLCHKDEFCENCHGPLADARKMDKPKTK